MGKTYVVFVGREIGVYDTWEQASEQVNGYKNNVHRSFSTKEAAEAAFLEYQKDHQKREDASSYSSSVFVKETKADASSSAVEGVHSGERSNEENHCAKKERDMAIQERDQSHKEELAALSAKIRSLAFE